ncbi:hypothetical protein G5C51_25055 [Streptomyces sp. A7024]|uniref:Uncharacterized protein n=1 Tax=Streptomyces coryli TaxID=1128680 RepID=A0A6G4U4R4_9ACTN|nr:hypothetical protein [Streptomyces coryli]NGN67164.1 hypothetical protein [Streptomyces coryli]
MSDSTTPPPDPLTTLAHETLAMLAAAQRRQTKLLSELAAMSAQVTELLRRLAPLPSGSPPVQFGSRTRALRLLDRWRRDHLLDESARAVAAYALPIVLNQGELRTAPEVLARFTGLSPRDAAAGLRTLVAAGCLTHVSAPKSNHYPVYRLGTDHRKEDPCP